MDKFTATVYGARAEEFRKVFGTTTVPILSLDKVRTQIDDLGERECFMLDLGALTAAQRASLEVHLQQKFSASLGEVHAALEYLGLPILADDCAVTIYQPGLL